MSILEAFLKGVWNLQKKGDGTLGNWPSDSYDLQLTKDSEHGTILAVSDEDGDNVKRYRVKLEEIK